MTATVVSRAWAWRSFMWAGVVGSVFAWAWVWFRQGGASALMLLFAVAAVAVAYRAASGVRVALVGLVVAGVTMFLASLYWTALLLMNGNAGVTTSDVLSTGVFPMVTAVVLLLGAVAGFFHAKQPTRSAQ